MTISVINIKTHEINYNNKTFKDFDKCLKYANLIVKDASALLSKTPQLTLSFEVRNTNADFMNCIRRALYDEISVYSMDVELSNITTNDKYIINDGIVKNNIEMIPFQQEITEEEIKKLSISLNVENNTMNEITVYSGNIVILKNSKEEDVELYFSKQIPLFKLKSNKSINIKDIGIIQDISKTNYGKFCLLSKITYKILDVIPFNENKFTKVGESSLNSNPTHFAMSFKTHRNITIKNVISKLCNILNTKFNDILTELKNIKNTDVVYFSELIELETKGEFKMFHFKKEYWSIVNVISRYCYLELPTVPYVAASIIHPSIENAVVTIQYTDAIGLITGAINQFLADIKIFEKSF